MKLTEAIPLVYKTVTRFPPHMNYNGVLCSSFKSNYYTFVNGATYKIPRHVWEVLVHTRKVTAVSEDSMFVFFNHFEDTKTGQTILNSLGKQYITAKEARYIRSALTGVLDPIHHPEVHIDEPFVMCYDNLYIERKTRKRPTKRALQFKNQLPLRVEEGQS